MDVVKVMETEPGHGEITIKLGGAIKKYAFTYDDCGFLLFHFPEDFQRLLNHLPVVTSQKIVDKIDKILTTSSVDLPYKIELEKEILASV